MAMTQAQQEQYARLVAHEQEVKARAAEDAARRDEAERQRRITEYAAFCEATRPRS